ncbi:MAG TPA: hypothetical protein VF002_05775 [Gaiellaceae bacterium]
MTAWLLERRTILAAALFSRLLVLGAAAADHWLHWPHHVSHTPHGASTAHTLSILSDWDGLWYRIVAERGYLLIPGRQSDPAFFPLFPIILRGFHALGLSYFVTGLLLANGAFVVGLLVFFELGKRLVSEEIARASTLLAAFFPMSFVFSMTYPESLVFAALALALLFALRRQWTASAVAAAAAAMGRPEALFFALPLGALALASSRHMERGARGRAIGAALAPVVSVATFPLYLGWSLHNMFAWSWAQHSWGRSFQLTGVVRAFTALAGVGHNPWLLRDVGLCVFYLVLIGVAHRIGVPLPWLVAGAAIVILPLASGTFMSEGRFGLLALPAYWGLGALARRRAVLQPVLIVSALLLVAGTMTIPLANP